MSIPAGPLNPRAAILTAVAQVYVFQDGEPLETLLVSAVGGLNKRTTRMEWEAAPGEVAQLLGWGARLSEDDMELLQVLFEATEALQGPQIARALNLDPENSGLRARLAPGEPLRAGGYVEHEKGEGYRITEKGSNAVRSWREQ